MAYLIPYVCCLLLVLLFYRFNLICNRRFGILVFCRNTNVTNPYNSMPYCVPCVVHKESLGCFSDLTRYHHGLFWVCECPALLRTNQEDRLGMKRPFTVCRNTSGFGLRVNNSGIFPTKLMTRVQPTIVSFNISSQGTLKTRLTFNFKNILQALKGDVTKEILSLQFVLVIFPVFTSLKSL